MVLLPYMKKGSKRSFKKHLNKRNYIIAGVLVIILLIVSLSLAKGNGEVSAQVESGAFKKETKVAGKVVAKDEALLGFTKSGRVQGLNVKVGDQIVEGQILARLDQSSAQASVALASSNLAYEDAKLDELARGSRDQEVKIQESKLSEADSKSRLAKESLYREMVNSYVISDDAVKVKLDQVFDSTKGFGEIYAYFSDYGLRKDINSSRREMKYLLDEWRDFNISISSQSFTSADVEKTKMYLEKVMDFADLVNSGVSKFTPSGAVTESQINSYKASVSSGRLAIQTQISTLTSKEDQYLNANQQANQAAEQLALIRAGASSEEIAAQRAKVLAEQARLADAQTLLSDSVIKAPFSGKVVQIDIEEGESVNANEIVLSVISDAGVEIESYIPEVFVGSVTKGDTAKVIFDAYPNRKFNAVVEEVEPKETLRDGISTYKTTLSFDDEGVNILLGMTTNITILAEERPNSIMVPVEAVQYEEGQAYVTIKDEDSTRVNIEVGDVDSDGRQEVLSGNLNPGDMVTYVQRN